MKYAMFILITALAVILRMTAENDGQSFTAGLAFFFAITVMSVWSFIDAVRNRRVVHEGRQADSDLRIRSVTTQLALCFLVASTAWVSFGHVSHTFGPISVTYSESSNTAGSDDDLASKVASLEAQLVAVKEGVRGATFSVLALSLLLVMLLDAVARKADCDARHGPQNIPSTPWGREAADQAA